MFCEPDTYRRDLLENLDTLEADIHKVVITYGRLQLLSQDVQINPVQAVDNSQQQHESLVTKSTTVEANLTTDVKALDVGSVITESSGTKSDKHDTSSSSGTFITHAVDADIRPVNDQEIDVLETITIELESSVAKLLAENEKLNKENEHLKQTYKELYDSIKKTRIQTKDHNDSLIAQKSSPPPTAVQRNKTPKSCLKVETTVEFDKIADLRWIPTGKMFTDYTTKVESEPPNGSNDDITNPYECDQTLNVGAGTANLSAGLNDWDLLLFPMIDEYFNPSPSVVQPILVAVVQEPIISTDTASSIRIDQDIPSISWNAKHVSKNAEKAGRRNRRVMVVSLHEVSENKGIVGNRDGASTEHTHQGTSKEVLVSTEGKYGDSDGCTFDDPTIMLEILSRKILLRLNLPDPQCSTHKRWSGVNPLQQSKSLPQAHTPRLNDLTTSMRE
ncbi:hypothetical protein Tco_0790220 [Tanacetum coccineum]